jgi:hypothetical protein
VQTPLTLKAVFVWSKAWLTAACTAVLMTTGRVPLFSSSCRRLCAAHSSEHSLRYSCHSSSRETSKRNSVAGWFEGKTESERSGTQTRWAARLRLRPASSSLPPGHGHPRRHLLVAPHAGAEHPSFPKPRQRTEHKKGERIVSRVGLPLQIFG